MAHYAQISDPALDAKVRARYAQEIASLQKLGFHYLASCLESQGPLSAIWQLPVLLLTLSKKELLVFPPPIRLGVANALLSHTDPPTIALCMGMGVKLYAYFGDGTLLVSSTFRSYAVPHPRSTIIKPAPSATIAEAWVNHSAAVRNMAHSRGTVTRLSTFDDYIKLSLQEEDRSQYQ